MEAQNPSLFRRLLGYISRIFKAFKIMLSIIFFAIFALFLIGIFSNQLPPIPEQGALYLAPSGVLVDQKSYIYPLDSLFADQTMSSKETLVRDIIESIDSAAYDPRITHLVMVTDFLEGASIAKLEEISHALMRFKATGKPVIAVADNFTQSQYFLAAHADEILLNPMGSVLITGIGAYGSYYRNALDKLDIKVHVFRAGDYKSAAEPFLRNNMSAEAKEDISAVINELWLSFTGKIESLRELEKGTIDNLANNLPSQLKAMQGDTARLAYKAGLVDYIATRSEMHNYLNSQIPNDMHGEFIAIEMSFYIANIRRENSQKQAADKIAVVVAKGTILDGEQPEGDIGGDTLSQILSDLRYDPQVKAIVLRIDSPGGSAFASDNIRDSLYGQGNQQVPIVVSMGSYAASGGYWIAAEADKIVAMPSTITGSIGVYSMIPTFEKTLASIGVNSDGVGTTDIADIMQLDRPMSKQAKVILQSSVDHIYDRFINLVANGRGQSPEAIHDIAQGRIWTGQQALKNGLVDQLGDLNDAIAAAAELAGIEDYSITYPSRILSPQEQFFHDISQNFSASIRKIGFSKFSSSLINNKTMTAITPLKHLREFNDPRGVYLRCDNCAL
jgi:protease IV